jgi:arginyl-tRNA synthetase
METLLSILQRKTTEALHKAFKEELAAHPDLLKGDVTRSTHPQFGHYQCNNALKLSKELKKEPRRLAEQIASLLDLTTSSGTPMISHVEIAGPGFINLTLDTAFLSQEIHLALQDPRLGVPLPEYPLRVIVEFSGPNVAKELHVGHLRSTIIGDSLARLFEFLGHDVLRLNHIGDWGTQFGMLIAYMESEAPEVLSDDKEIEISTLMHWYRESKKIFDRDPEFKKRAHNQVIALQAGDPRCLKAWRMICEVSRRAYQEIYDLLDVKIIERGESFYNPYLKEIVDDLEKKGLITLSDGAKCIFVEGFQTQEGSPLPMIIQKSDGGYNYDTTDMASLRHRIEVERADRILYVVDAGQSLHFQMLFKVGELAGYLDPKKVCVEHVAFGVVLGADGKKFKTRSGEVERLIELLYRAIGEAKNILRARLDPISDEELNTLAKILGIDAIKYADLSCHRLKDYLFSYERMLKFEGNTAAFLLYAFVRIQGIKRKVNRDLSQIQTSIILEHPSEITLALHLRQFGEILDLVSRDLLPNRLCDYLYTLAEKFHAFFRDCRVEGAPEEESRLLLCEITARILEKGLHLLGLKTMPRM